MQRKLTFSEGEFYHIYNRGTDKRDIFLDNRDRERFVKLLFYANGTQPVVLKDIPQGRPLGSVDKGNSIVALGAYCLMPNHFHLLVKEISEGGITKFMSKLSTAYSMYFNKKNGRTGALFEGKFKATHANNDTYLKYLLSYIHLNPVKNVEAGWKENTILNRENAKQYLEKYIYSSYLDYIGEARPEKDILDTEAFPEYFSSFGDFKNFIDEWLSYPKGRP
ncbi:MAG: transposase [bacterium]|nr:transposase [bacterium]